jgi:hypothetical protein
VPRCRAHPTPISGEYEVSSILRNATRRALDGLVALPWHHHDVLGIHVGTSLKSSCRASVSSARPHQALPSSAKHSARPPPGAALREPRRAMSPMARTLSPHSARKGVWHRSVKVLRHRGPDPSRGEFSWCQLQRAVEVRQPSVRPSLALRQSPVEQARSSRLGRPQSVDCPVKCSSSLATIHFRWAPCRRESIENVAADALVERSVRIPTLACATCALLPRSRSTVTHEPVRRTSGAPSPLTQRPWILHKASPVPPTPGKAVPVRLRPHPRRLSQSRRGAARVS